MNSNESWVGKQINQYEVQEYLTRGGMADIYKAYDAQLKRTVCLKVMQAALLDDVAFVKRFQREARTAARLNHPDIIKIFDTGVTADNQPFLVMEYIEAGSLDRLVARGEIEWPFPVVDALKFIKRLAAALSMAHYQRVYHRDLKPQNVLMRHGTHPVLTDFGVAAVEEGTKLTRTGEMPGTPLYMSPEQIRGEPVDGRSDIYALGLILYEMLAGSHPFAHLDPWRMLDYQATVEPPPLRLGRDDLSEATYRIVHSCLHKHPANRYQSTVDLIAALDEAIREEQGEGEVEKSPTRFSPFLRENWMLLLLILLVLALLVVAIISLLPQNDGSAAAATATNNVDVLSSNLPTVVVATMRVLPTSTPAAIVSDVAPTRILATPTHSVTPLPTDTPVSTETAVPPTTTPIPPVIVNNVIESSACTITADSLWDDFIDQYKSRLGCGTTGLMAIAYELNAYQPFPNGFAIWRGDRDLVYVLDNTSQFSAHDIRNVDQNNQKCEPFLKGGIGSLWCNNNGISTRLGLPVVDEKNSSGFVVQDFANGLVFTADDLSLYYVLFTNTGEWTAVAK
ncbi:MAG: serine/threonine protein kinase [Chloroflexi bacterium]|nr:serine/threonine protein kinase [Chloroflexota bacterium]